MSIEIFVEIAYARLANRVSKERFKQAEAEMGIGAN